MLQVSIEQVRQYRLRAHHLDRAYSPAELEAVAGACGFQNSPPGAWELSLHNRIPSYSREDMQGLLEREKRLLQAWSYRGAPVVFPIGESKTFSSGLIAQGEEPWVYTRGIQLALDHLSMPFDQLLNMLRQVMPRLDGQTIQSKTALDQTLAEWMLPLMPQDKQVLWNQPSMYGNPDKQTVGGAVVSFLLRPCAFLGLVVFAAREGAQPTFTSYQSWVGQPLEPSPAPEQAPEQALAEKYLRCYGPGTVTGFADWLGCSPAQARRMWKTVDDNLEPALVSGKERYILSADKDLLLSPPQPERTLHLLGGHDPYLFPWDKAFLLPDPALQRIVWQTVSNPGVVLSQGEVLGVWKTRKQGKGLKVEITLWDKGQLPKAALQVLCEEYASFQELALNRVTFLQ